MLAEEELSQQGVIRQAVDWVKNEAQARHVMVEVCSELIEERRGDYYTFIMMPVEIPDLETDEFLETLGSIQSKWNNREPRPDKRLFLYPAGVPRHAI